MTGNGFQNLVALTLPPDASIPDPATVGAGLGTTRDSVAVVPNSCLNKSPAKLRARQSFINGLQGLWNNGVQLLQTAPPVCDQYKPKPKPDAKSTDPNTHPANNIVPGPQRTEKEKAPICDFEQGWQHLCCRGDSVDDGVAVGDCWDCKSRFYYYLFFSSPFRHGLNHVGLIFATIYR